MEFNTPYTTPASRPTSYSQPPSYYFSLPYTSLLSPPSHSYAVADTSEPLDALIIDVEPATRRTPLDQFLDRKKRFAARSVEDILGLIYERQGIKYTMAREIDYEHCYLKSKLLETDTWRTGFNPQLDKTRGQIQSNLLALDQEKRREEVACWRDTTRLKTELREVLREFDQEKHKTGLLTSPWKSENSAGN